LTVDISFQAAARFGYLGTMYSALRKVGAAPESRYWSTESAAPWASALPSSPPPSD
jgi:hypothetical protein